MKGDSSLWGLWGYCFSVEILFKYNSYDASGFFSYSSSGTKLCLGLVNTDVKRWENLYGYLNGKTKLFFFYQVTITFKEYEDNAIWIRVAWGTPYKKPNQYKPSYVVYHSQTPYVFISASMLKSNLPLLCQVQNKTAQTLTSPQSCRAIIGLAFKRMSKDSSLNIIC